MKLKNIYKILIFLIVIMLVSGNSVNAFSTDLNASSQKIKLNEEIIVEVNEEVTIEVNASEDILTGSFYLNYDSKYFSFEGSKTSNLIVKDYSDEGIVKAVYFNLQETGVKKLEFKFKAKEHTEESIFKITDVAFVTESLTSYNDNQIEGIENVLSIKIVNNENKTYIIGGIIMAMIAGGIAIFAKKKNITGKIMGILIALALILPFTANISRAEATSFTKIDVLLVDTLESRVPMKEMVYVWVTAIPRNGAEPQWDNRLAADTKGSNGYCSYPISDDNILLNLSADDVVRIIIASGYDVPENLSMRLTLDSANLMYTIDSLNEPYKDVAVEKVDDSTVRIVIALEDSTDTPTPNPEALPSNISISNNILPNNISVCAMIPEMSTTATNISTKTIAELKDDFEVANMNIVSIKDHSGQEILDDNELIGTGMTIELADGTEHKIIVYGDATGDGKVNASDIAVIINDYLGRESVSDEYRVAVDVHNDGSDTLNATDIYRLIHFYLGDLGGSLVMNI